MTDVEGDNGNHYLERGTELIIARRVIGPLPGLHPFWILPGQVCTPTWAASLGYRYVCPVPTPEEICAQAAEITRLTAERDRYKLAWEALGGLQLKAIGNG